LEEEIEELPVDTDRKDTLKYEVRFTKYVMAAATPLLTHITFIPTNTQCSTSFGHFTFDDTI
jgi:hypothetical protein